MKNTKGLSRTVYYSLAVGVVLLSIRPLAAGENLTPPELATTVMTEALLGNGNFLAAKAGTDAMHPLHFSTIVDQFGQSFSYEASGQYNGQQLSISGTGTVTTGGKWILNSRTQLGASQWSVPGTLALTPLSAHGGRYDLNTSQSIVDPNATGGGTWTDVGIIVCCGPAPSPPSKDDLKCCGQQYPSTDFTSIDPSAGTWDVSDTWVSGSVVIHADTPIGGETALPL